VVGAILVNELDLADADLLVDARTLLGGGLRGSDRAANVFFSFVVATSRSRAERTTTDGNPRR
jgi:hypothetical protein